MAAKSFEVKLSSIAKDIADASDQFANVKKARKSLSKRDQRRLDLGIKHLRQANKFIQLACGRTGRMTAIFVPNPEPTE